MFNQNLTIVVTFLVALLILAFLVRRFAPSFLGKDLKYNSNSNEMSIIASLAIEPGVRLHKIDVEDRTLLLIVNSNRNSSVSAINYNAATSLLNNDTMRETPDA
ncbi:MAG: FliO/MopB family protein [Tateyamaria sp.]|jgi:flagellar biogenesis protein FliO|nr:FliO/MopB family protein [Tateyamaria sp.]